MTASSLLYLAASYLLGIWIAFALPFSLPSWSRILFGPTLGMVLLGHLTFFIGLLSHFDSTSIFLGILLTALVTLYLNLNRQFSFDRLKFKGSISELIHSWPLWIVVLTLGSVVVYVYATRVLAPVQNGLIISRGGLYGDTAFHNSQITGFAYQGIPLLNPIYSGIPFRYPFLVNFFAACLLKLGMSLRLALILPQISNFLAFLTLFHVFSKRMTTHSGVFFSFLVLLLGWGFGFVSYLNDSIATGSWAVTKEYTNNLQDFRMQNFITALFLPQRGMLSGFVIGLLLTVCFLFQEGPLTRRQGAWLGVLLGILPLWHAHSFLFLSFSLLFWMTFRYRSHWENNRHGILTFACVSAALSLPVMIWFSQQLSPSMRLQYGWTTPQQNIILFWINNTGLAIPLALFSIRQPAIKRELYVFAPALIVFLAANFIVFQPWAWDDIKLFVWVFLFVSVLAGGYLGALFSRGPGFKIATFILLLILTASGTLSIIQLLSPGFVTTIYDRHDIDLAEWVRKNTSPFSTFLISDVPAHPVTGLAGRSPFLGYPGHVWTHGIDYRPRLAIQKRILQGDLSALHQLEIPVEFIVAETSKPLAKHHGNLSICFKNSKYTVFRVDRDSLRQ